MNGESLGNHRTRVAAERREKTRARLLESALLVFAEKGPDAAVIDDVIALAGISRGSFYNYFRTNSELADAVAAQISDELLTVIDPVVQLQPDPVGRIAVGCRLLLHTTQAYPLLGAFMSALRWPSAGAQLLGIKFLTRDLDAGIRQGKFTCAQPRVAVDLVVGTLFAASLSLAMEDLPEDYPEAVACAMLQGLGVRHKDAERMVKPPLPDIELDEHSILKRTLERSRHEGSGHS